MTSRTEQRQAGSEAQNIADEKARKEELVEARIRMMRKKNEELMKRQKEIEEDRKNANKYSEMVIKKHHEHAASGVVKESPATGIARGRGRGLLLQEMRKETLKAKQWEAKRRENVQREEQERRQGSKTSNTVSSFLADDDRVDMSRTTGRNEHSWGGANFNRVVNRVQREKEGFRSGRNKGNIEITMSGKERQQYYQWREERLKIDEERKARQKKTGNWSRAWDQKKVWDPRKKMWVYEDDADNYNDIRRRRQESDNSEDWGSNNRDSRTDNRGRGKSEQASGQGFVQHDNCRMEVSEEWGETSDKTVTQNKFPGSKTETDNTLSYQPSAVRGLGSGEDWEVEIPTTEENKVISEHLHSDAPTAQRELKQTRELNDSVPNNQPNDSRDFQKDQESATAVMSGQSHSDIPKPQREPRRKKQNDSVVNEQVNIRDPHKWQESVAEEMSPSDKPDLHKPPTGHKYQDEHIHVQSRAVSDDLENKDGDDKNNDKVITDNETRGSLSKTPVEEKQDTVTSLGHSVEKVQTSEVEDTVSNPSRAAKANLPKLVTKIDKKVTFDTEKNDCKKESESKDVAVSLDIPPTPDFLKVEKGLDWADFEIDEEEVVERW